MTVGIYSYHNTKTDIHYIGGSIYIEDRIGTHIGALRNGRHVNYLLQEAYDTDGPEVFEILLLEETSVEDLRDRENYWISQIPNQYNIKPYATYTGLIGHVHTDEAKEKISKASQLLWDTGVLKLDSEEARRRTNMAKKENRAAGARRRWADPEKRAALLKALRKS